MAGKPTALKIDAISLIAAQQLSDDELADDVLARRDPAELAKALASLGVTLAGGGANRKAVVDFLAHLSDRIEEKEGKAA